MVLHLRIGGTDSHPHLHTRNFGLGCVSGPVTRSQDAHRNVVPQTNEEAYGLWLMACGAIQHVECEKGWSDRRRTARLAGTGRGVWKRLTSWCESR